MREITSQLRVSSGLKGQVGAWSLRVGLAASSMGAAVALTHAFWRHLQHTPFILGFVAAVVCTRIGGRHAGWLAVAAGIAGYAWFPPPVRSIGPLLLGFAGVSGTFAWLIARRYEMEAALRASEARLTEAQQVANVGAWEMNVADGSESWSDQLYRIFGVGREAVKPSLDTLYRFLHPDDRSIVAGVLQRALGDHRPFECENRIIRPDGAVRTLHVHGRVIVDEDGRVVRVVGTAQDITDRKAAEDRLARSERRLRTIIDAQPACVKLVSVDGRVLNMNPAGLRMLGATCLSDVVGQPVIDLVHEEDRKRYLQAHRDAAGGSQASASFRIVTADGSERFLESVSVPFDASIESDTAERAVLSVTRDVTEHKKLEGQLRQAQKMEAIGCLAGGVAHDFNNLLTAIGGFTELALYRSRDSHVRDELFEVRKATDRAAALTRQLLAFSRRQVLTPRVLELNALVVDAEKLLRRTIPASITMTLDLDPQLADNIRADAGQLEQVLLNLAVNASDAMPDGGDLRFATDIVDIDPSTMPRYAPMAAGRYVRLTISDTGHGIDEQLQTRIFEPFFTTKERGRGTGLGLSTVYGIVKQSGGFIWVSSRPGAGTTFEILFPAVQESVDPQVRLEDAPLIAGGRETILLAEDDGGVRRLTEGVLSGLGYTVLAARDGEEALEVAAQHPHTIQLLLTDVVMPGLSGRQLAARLALVRPEMRVLYTTGYEETSDRGGLHRGVAMLPKPFTPRDLAQTVQQVLAR